MNMLHASLTIAVGVGRWRGVSGRLHAMERGVADRSRRAVRATRPVA